LSGFDGSIAVADGNEAPRDDIKLLAENLARVEATMATKEELQAAVGRLEEEFKTAIGGLERTFSRQIGQLASPIASRAFVV